MINPSPETITLVQQWVFYAEEDFRNAQHTLKLKRNCPFSTVCFHAQQVIEKYIKALLTLQSIPFSKTHDIETLVSQLPKHITLPLSTEEQRLLTDYATVSRYPGEWEPLTRKESQEALTLARKIRTIIRKHLPPKTLRHPSS